jgi:cold shock CspA family protein
MENGTIVRVVLERQFGFIARSGIGRDVFFHMSALRGGMHWDEQLIQRPVRFETEPSPNGKGPRAVEIWPA